MERIDLYYNSPDGLGRPGWCAGSKRFSDAAALMEWIDEHLSMGRPLLLTSIHYPDRREYVETGTDDD